VELYTTNQQFKDKPMKKETPQSSAALLLEWMKQILHYLVLL
jgi:hypothetical protein